RGNFPIQSQVGRNVSLENDRRSGFAILLPEPLLHLCQRHFALSICDPCNLKWMISFQHAVGVIVDRFPWSREKTGGGVVFTQDEMGVCLTALQGDSNGDLSQRTASEGIGSAECLRAENDMNAECPPLPDKPIQMQRRILSDLVILDKKFLKFI